MSARSLRSAESVIAGLGPGIPPLLRFLKEEWIRGSSPRMTRSALKPQTNSADWKLHEYHPEKPAHRRKRRHRFLGRARHQRGAAVDEAKRRPRLCLYREPRPA